MLRWAPGVHSLVRRRLDRPALYYRWSIVYDTDTDKEMEVTGFIREERCLEVPLATCWVTPGKPGWVCGIIAFPTSV